MSTEVLWYLGRATGIVSLTLFSAVLILGMATAARAPAGALPRAAVSRLHRQLSLLAVIFLLVHIITAIVDGYVDLGWLDVVIPFTAGYAPLWIGLGAVAVDLMIAVGISSLLRSLLPRRVWRAIHLTAYAMWPLAVLHSLFNPGGDAGVRWLQIAVAVNVVAVLLAAVRWRLRSDRHPDALARRAGDRLHQPELSRSQR